MKRERPEDILVSMNTGSVAKQFESRFPQNTLWVSTPQWKRRNAKQLADLARGRGWGVPATLLKVKVVELDEAEGASKHCWVGVLYHGRRSSRQMAKTTEKED